MNNDNKIILSKFKTSENYLQIKAQSSLNLKYSHSFTWISLVGCYKNPLSIFFFLIYQRISALKFIIVPWCVPTVF